MTEVRNEKGDLLAVIHDQEAFNALVDEYETHFRAYHLCYTHFMYKMAVHFKLLTHQEIHDAARAAAVRLTAIRQQVGDQETERYPITEFPIFK